MNSSSETVNLVPILLPSASSSCKISFRNCNRRKLHINTWWISIHIRVRAKIFISIHHWISYLDQLSRSFQCNIADYIVDFNVISYVFASFLFVSLLWTFSVCFNKILFYSISYHNFIAEICSTLTGYQLAKDFNLKNFSNQDFSCLIPTFLFFF